MYLAARVGGGEGGWGRAVGKGGDGEWSGGGGVQGKFHLASGKLNQPFLPDLSSMLGDHFQRVFDSDLSVPVWGTPAVAFPG